MTELALNLAPQDEVQMDGQWWIVVEHSVTVAAAAAVKLQLRSEDRECFAVIAVPPMFKFEYRRPL